MSQASETRQLLRKLRDQGAAVTRSENHWHVYDSAGHLLVRLPTHPVVDRGHIRSRVRSALTKAGFRL